MEDIFMENDSHCQSTCDSPMETMDNFVETVDKGTERLNSSMDGHSDSDFNTSVDNCSDDASALRETMVTREQTMDNVDYTSGVRGYVDDDENDENGVDGSMDEAQHQNEARNMRDEPTNRGNPQLTLSSDSQENYSQFNRSADSLGTTCGKYTLRSARHADPLHFIHKIKQYEDVDPEMEDLVTVIRTTETGPEIEEKGRTIIQSLITSELVRQFENPGVEDHGTDQHDIEPNVEIKYRVLPNVSDNVVTKPTSSSGGSQQMTSSLEPPSVPAPIASLSELELSDDSDLGLGGHHPEDDLQNMEHHDQDESCRRADEENVFEHIQKHGELSSPTHQAMSLKEELANQEEEKDGVSMEDEERMDVIGDLNHPFAYAQGKDRSSSNRLEELDLTSTETPGLNLEASKQRVKLRQRGSLAHRRKPTRTSVRSASTGDVSIYTDNRDSSAVNGHDVSSDDDDDTRDNMTNIDMSTASQSQLIQPGKTIHGIKTAIVQSEVIESGRQRLRSLPNPGNSESKLPSVNPEEPDPVTPPWLTEARLKRLSRPPQGETEKLKQETEPEKPAWMKEALTKKNRAVNRTSQNSSVEETPSTSDDANSPKIVPWMQETARRRSVRTMPLAVSQKDVTNNVNNLIADSSCSTKTELIEDISDMDTSNGQEVFSSMNNEPTNRMNGHLNEQENLPPIKRALSLEPSPAKKTYTQQLSLSSLSPGTAEQEEPTWKVEVAIRRKSKSYIVSQKPDQPIRLGETPQWKKDLLEKKKQRRVSTDGSESLDKNMEISDQSTSLPPWKQEVAQRRSSRLSSSMPPDAFEDILEKPKSSEKTPEEEPEWAQLVARRRQRLASSGLLPADEATNTE